jgi:pyruvyltransferase
MTTSSTDSAVSVNYFVHVPNVGDRVTPLIVEVLSGRRATYVADLDTQPHLMAVGSIAHRATPQTVIWGSGVMAPAIGLGSPRPHNVLALRGRRSYEAYREAGIGLGDVPLGDPAVLAARLLGIQAAVQPAHPVGVVAHYAERNLPAIRRLLCEDGVIDLDVHAEPQEFLERMATCRAIVSTSLHGLIFAESLGLPNLWMKASDLLGGGAFKFEDWFSTTRRPQRAPHLLSDSDSATALAGRADVHDLAVDQEALIAAFPRDRTDLLSALRPGFLGVHSCRQRPMPVFLVSSNRGDALRAISARLQQQTVMVDIIVHDAGSDDPATHAVLAHLEQQGIAVVRCRAASGSQLLRDVADTVRDYFAAWAEPRSFAVGRDGVDLSSLHPRALELYGELSNRFPVVCAGPAHGMGPAGGIETPLAGFGTVYLASVPDDFTFAVYRAGTRLECEKTCMRAIGPFAATN